MSGPKVVRVVTRAEVVGMCQALFAQLEQAVESWMSTAERLGQLDTMELAAIEKRRSELRALFRSEAFLEVQKRVPEETEFLESSRQRLIENAARALTFARERASRDRDNAAVLLAEIERKLPGKHADTCDALRAIIRGASPADPSETVLARSFLLLSSSEPGRQLSQAQRELASRLAPVEDSRAYEHWKKLRHAATDKRLSELQQRLGLLEAERGSQAVAEFTQRLLTIEKAGEDPSGSMKLDALVLDVAQALKTARERLSLQRRARALLAELDTLHGADAIPEMHTALQRALSSNDPSLLSSSLDASTLALEETRKKQAARARREAILGGLAALGYEVREGMATCWAEQGRIVLRKPNLDGYGIELAGAPDAQRMQLRSVAFSADRDKARDRDIETLWCGDVTKLQALVRSQQGSLIIEKALPVGQVPLKVVDTPDSDTRESQDAAQVVRSK
jgi:hypothetical protein